MSARDLFHESVKIGLQKQQWLITADPLSFRFGKVRFQVDLAADRLIAAQRENEKIAVEIKSFINTSAITDFYTALGQFLSYKLALAEVEPDRRLYLAVPLEIYNSFFQLPFTQNAIDQYQVSLIVYEPVKEEIVLWID